MRIGFHISVAGGFQHVIERAQARSCTTIQIFSRNPRAWKFRPLKENDVELYIKKIEQSKIKPVFIHMPYLVNLASSDKHLHERSVASLVAELHRAASLKAHYVIMHIGSSKKEKKGIQDMITGINRALQTAKNKVILLLENTPKSGNEIGNNFGQINAIIKSIEPPRRIGVVFDTAHAFAAGYPLQTKKGVARTLHEFNRIIGIEKLRLIHFNDSKTEFGSCRDRHWHIGKGNIGKGMGYILNHPLLKTKPFILETPRKNLQDDLMNLKMVTKLLDISKEG